MIREALEYLLGLRSPTAGACLVPTPDGRHALHVTSDGYRVEVADGPTVATPAHTFTDLGLFAAWLNREQAMGRWDSCRADVTVDVGAIDAVADPYADLSPAVRCSLAYHPLWSAWIDVAGKWLSPEALFEFLRGVAESLAPVTVTVSGTPRQVPGVRSWLEALQTLAISDDGQVEVRRDATGRATFRGATGKTTVSGSIAPEIELLCPVYLASPDDRVSAEVLVSTRITRGDAGPALALRLRMPGREIAELTARQMLATRLQAALDGWLVTVGAAEVDRRIGPIA